MDYPEAKVVREYSVPIEDKFAIEMERGAHAMTVQMVNGVPKLYAFVDPTEPMQRRLFRLAEAGQAVMSGWRMRYVGTFQMGERVLHLFERKTGGV